MNFLIHAKPSTFTKTKEGFNGQRPLMQTVIFVHLVVTKAYELTICIGEKTIISRDFKVDALDA